MYRNFKFLYIFGRKYLRNNQESTLYPKMPTTNVLRVFSGRFREIYEVQEKCRRGY